MAYELYQLLTMFAERSQEFRSQFIALTSQKDHNTLEQLKAFLILVHSEMDAQKFVEANGLAFLSNVSLFVVTFRENRR